MTYWFRHTPCVQMSYDRKVRLSTRVIRREGATRHISTIRVIGNPELKCTKIGLSVGAPASMAQINILQRNDIEVLIAGESREWGTVEYVRDAVDEEMNKAIILPVLMKTVNSEMYLYLFIKKILQYSLTVDDYIV